MKEFPTPSSESPVVSEDEKRRNEFYRASKAGIEETFKTFKNSSERVAYIKSTLEGITPLIQEKEGFLSRLEACAEIESKDEFVEAIFQLFKPIVDKKFSDPESFLDEGERKQEFIALNEVVSYELSGDRIFIHIYVNQVPEKRDEQILSKFKEAMQKLAEIVQEYPEINLIEGDSLMVARRPRAVERFGFTIDDETIESGLKRRAYISREDFLKKYLNKGQ
ncbi:MAG: hypothetical protein WAT84_01270 [Candidatus Moraniibacteriota bacterium]